MKFKSALLIILGLFLTIEGYSQCQPVTLFSTGGLNACAGAAKTYSIVSGLPPMVTCQNGFAVSIGSFTFDTGTSFTLTFPNTGTFEVDFTCNSIIYCANITVIDDQPTPPAGFNAFSQVNYCLDEVINLSINEPSDPTSFYRWERSFNGVNWSEFSFTNGSSTTYTTVPRPNYPYTVQFRVRKQSTLCNSNFSSFVRSGTATVFPPRPEVTLGAESSPECPGGIDGVIPITIEGQVEDYVFTLCPDPAGGPVICFNWVESRTVSAWENVPYLIQAGIPTLQRTGVNGMNGTDPIPLEVSAGSYMLFVEPQSATDICEFMVSPVVPEALPLVVTSAFEANSVLTCLEGNDGSIQVVTQRGTGPLTYNVHEESDFSDTPVFTSSTSFISGLTSGTYYISVTDNCMPVMQTAFYKSSPDGVDPPVGIPLTISEPPFTSAFRILTADGIDALCASTPPSESGSATVTVVNPSGEVTYQLIDAADDIVEDEDSPNTTFTFDRAHVPGNYTVRVTDEDGCVATEPVLIGEPAALSFTVDEVDILCLGASNGSITITGAGGSGTYQYSINAGADWFDTNTFPGLAPGNYTPALRDVSVDGTMFTCEDNPMNMVTITEPLTSVTIDNVTQTQFLECFNDTDGRLLVEVSGGTPNVTQGYTFRILDGGSEVQSGFGINSFEFTDLFAANFTIEVNDGNGNVFGCFATTTFDLMQPDMLDIQSATALMFVGGNNISCNGFSDGEITVITEGGTYPHDVTIDGELQTISAAGQSVVFTDLTAGTYNISVVDMNGCDLDEAITLTEPDDLLIDQTTLLTYVGGNNISCQGFSDGELTVTSMGGVLPHDVTVNGETQQITATVPSVTFTGLSAISYSIVITDVNNCTDTRDVTLTEPLVFEVLSADVPTLFGGNNLECNGDDDATVAIRTTGGTYPHDVTVNSETQTLNSPTEQANFTNLSAGNYIISISDANNCLNTGSFTVLEPDLLELDPSGTTIVQPECFGENTASLTLRAMGGTLINGNNYHYEIDHQNIPPDLPFTFPAHQELDGIDVTFADLIAGEYLVSVFDHFDCMYQETINITTINQLTLDLQSVDIICKGETNGMASLGLSGGTPPYTVIWQNSLREAIETDMINATETALLENIGEGLYYFRISDASGCEYFQSGFSFSVEGPAEALTLQANVRDITCNGDNNGFVQLQAIGGWQEQAYRYGTSLTDLSVGNTFFENLVPGIYTFYVQDNRGCTDLLEVTISEPDVLTLTTSSVTTVSCNGGNDGQVILQAAGGRTPYAFSLDAVNYQNMPDFDGLVAGDYTFQVQDVSGCVAFHNVTITEPDALIVNLTNISDTRCGESRGSAEAQVSGGTLPYIFRWFDENDVMIGSNNSINSLFGGNYLLEVEDANGCISSADLEIINTNDIRIEVSTIQPVSCFGGADGSIDITILQSTPPVTINWSHGPETEDVQGLTAGIYTVTFSDAAGCDISETIEIISPEPLGLIVVQNQMPTCFQGCDGELTIEATGGTTPYSYRWLEGGQTTAVISDQCAGDYTIEITDANGCMFQEVITINETNELEIGLGNSSTICEGQVVSLDAGVWESYQWSSTNGFTSTDRNVTLTEGGTYNLLTIDQEGCQAQESFEVIISNDLLDADFLIPSEGFVGDTIVCIDISFPLVDDITWQYDQLSFDALREEGPFLDLELLQAGTFSITMSATLGGCADDQVYDILVREDSERGSSGGRVGFGNTGLKKYNVYPNPSSGVFWADIELFEASDIELSMINLSGTRVFYEYRGQGQSEYQVRVNVENIPQGVYLLSLITPEETKVVRVFVE